MPPSNSAGDDTTPAGDWIPVAPRRRGARPSDNHHNNNDQPQLDENRVPDLVPRVPNVPSDDDDSSDSSMPPLIYRPPIDSSDDEDDSDDDDDSLPALVNQPRGANDDSSSTTSSSLPDLVDRIDDYDSTSDEDNNNNSNAADAGVESQQRFSSNSRNSGHNDSHSPENDDNPNMLPRIFMPGLAMLPQPMASAFFLSSLFNLEGLWEGGYETEDADGWSDGEARDNDDWQEPQAVEHTVTVLECGDTAEDRKLLPAGHVFPRIEGEPWKYDDDESTGGTPRPPAPLSNPFGTAWNHYQHMGMPSMMEHEQMGMRMSTMREHRGEGKRLFIC